MPHLFDRAHRLETSPGMRRWDRRDARRAAGMGGPETSGVGRYPLSHKPGAEKGSAEHPIVRERSSGFARRRPAESDPSRFPRPRPPRSGTRLPYPGSAPRNGRGADSTPHRNRNPSRGPGPVWSKMW